MQRIGWIALVAISACGSRAATSQVDGVVGTYQAGLQYTGAMGYQRDERVEISAPILPDMVIWQYKGGAGYPSTAAEATALVRDTTYTYEHLLEACQPKYREIVLYDGTPLTREQLETNYDQVSRCAYYEYGCKPYWMPQILDDVDVCALKLGTGWRLLAEDDIDGFSEVDFQFFKDTMSIAQGGDWFPRQFYFSLDAYVRARDGSLVLGNLAPSTDHLVPLPIAPSDMTVLYFGNGQPIGVRCVSVTPAQ